MGNVGSVWVCVCNAHKRSAWVSLTCSHRFECLVPLVEIVCEPCSTKCMSVSEQIKTIISLLLEPVNEYNIWFHITLLMPLLLLRAWEFWFPSLQIRSISPFHFISIEKENLFFTVAVCCCRHYSPYLYSSVFFFLSILQIFTLLRIWACQHVCKLERIIALWSIVCRVSNGFYFVSFITLSVCLFGVWVRDVFACFVKRIEFWHWKIRQSVALAVVFVCFHHPLQPSIWDRHTFFFRHQILSVSY